MSSKKRSRLDPALFPNVDSALAEKIAQIQGKADGGLTPIAGAVPRRWQNQLGPSVPSLLERRLGALSDAPSKNPLFMPSVFCQICLPYRDPSDDVREWYRDNGNTTVKIYAGEVEEFQTREFTRLGLPWGIKARLCFMAITKESKVTNSRMIDIGRTLHNFTRRKLNIDCCSRNRDSVREQMARLTSALIQITTGVGYETLRHRGIMTCVDVWKRSPDGRFIWPEALELSRDFHENVVRNSVPLDERHIAALSHSAMALDVYCWLAHRLRRLEAPITLSWEILRRQFGQDYDSARLDKFREVFRRTLREVLAVYKAAKIEECTRGPRKSYPAVGGGLIVREPALKGLTLHPSKPPVPERLKG